jgi:hypothetical protein
VATVLMVVQTGEGARRAEEAQQCIQAKLESVEALQATTAKALAESSLKLDRAHAQQKIDEVRREATDEANRKAQRRMLDKQDSLSRENQTYKVAMDANIKEGNATLAKTWQEDLKAQKQDLEDRIAKIASASVELRKDLLAAFDVLGKRTLDATDRDALLKEFAELRKRIDALNDKTVNAVHQSDGAPPVELPNVPKPKETNPAQ